MEKRVSKKGLSIMFLYAAIAAGAAAIAALLAFFIRRKTKAAIPGPVADAVREAGFAYDPRQDIFYSLEDAWQKKYGYTRLYDDAAAPLGMIVDCEPVFFDWGGRRWMIGIWKGQYGMAAGAELGVYTAPPSALPPGAVLYAAAAKEDELNMAFRLCRGGEDFITRSGASWWLTGFKLGEFSEPGDLAMDVQVELKSGGMRDAYLSALLKMGYRPGDIRVRRDTVQFRLDKPHSSQPFTRTGPTDRLIQSRNKRLCALFQSLTDQNQNAASRLAGLRQSRPDLYQKALGMGRPRRLYQERWGL